MKKVIFLIILLSVLVTITVTPTAAEIEGRFQFDYLTQAQEATGQTEIGYRINNLAIGGIFNFDILNQSANSLALFSDLQIPTDPGLHFRITAIWYEIELDQPQEYKISIIYEF